MPDHVHGIVWIGAGAHDPETSCDRSYSGAAPRSLAAVIQKFKSIATRKIKSLDLTQTIIWQRNHYESVLRTEADVIARRKYIAENPECWAERERLRNL
jgi:putative transposase